MKKIMIGLLFVIATVSRVASEAAHSKDIYGGQREDDHGAKPIMAQLQFANNVGHNSHYVLGPVGQSQHHKHPMSVSFGPSLHASSHAEPVPYPGVFSYQSRLGPIQYSLSQQHQPMSHQPPIHMVLTYHPNSPPSHRNIINQIHHNPPPPPPTPSSLNHITIGGPQYYKFSQAPHNIMQPIGQHFLHIPQQHHSFRPQSHQSPFVPIAVPLQYVQHKPTSGQTFSMLPSHHQAVLPTASAIATAVPATASAQQDEQQQHSAIPTPQATTTTVLQPVQHYGGSNQQEIQYQHFTHPSASQAYHQQQQPHYSYSIQPSIQVAATKQVVVPVSSSSPQQYKQDSSSGSSQYSNEPGIASSYFSLVREYTMNPAKTAVPAQQQHHVYLPTHSTPVYSTSKPYVVASIHPTGPGSTVDYTSSAGALQVYQQIGGKASTVSATKYA